MNQTEAQIKEDLDYWKELGDLLGWQVMGWTYKFKCTYILAGETININGEQRDRTLKFLKKWEHNAYLGKDNHS